jgi:hypothetical protein
MADETAPPPADQPVTDSPEAPAGPPPPSPPGERDPEIVLEVDHSAYYRRVPIKNEDVTPEMLAEEGLIIDSTWPGFKLKRETVYEPTTSTTTIHLPSVQKWNDDREAAGLARRPHHVNLAIHLTDGPYSRHFPLGSITDVRCSDPEWEAQMRAHLVAGEDF